MKLVLRILFFLLLGALAIGLYYKNQIEFRAKKKYRIQKT